MHNVYGRDLDLNLLRVFAVVAESGSVTQAASRLYLTQPAVSAALRRLTECVGAKLLSKQGRSLVLTTRGRQLQHALHAHLEPLVHAALQPSEFQPRTSERTLRVGFSDAAEVWLLPRLLRLLAVEAPCMQIVSLPVQFRTVSAALSQGLDMAVTVADELPRSIVRQELRRSPFVCVFDSRCVKRRRLTEDQYFALEHVVVSYNGDLRGVVEDTGKRARTVRCSVSGFANLRAILEGTALVATVPAIVAENLVMHTSHLRAVSMPFELASAPLELLWPNRLEEDPAARFVRDQILMLAK
jgi:LysR family transcriptional regulator, mexEF-oprN operon transcriptional activator